MTKPRYPSGHVPFKDFADTHGEYGLRLALVTRVDEINLKADLKVLTGVGERFEIDLTQAMAGPRSFWGGVPEINSIVVIGYRRIHKNLQDAVILGYIPVGNKSGLRFDPFSPIDPSLVTPEESADVADIFGPATRFKRLMLKPGNVGGMSSDGAELVLSKDLSMVNRAGDTIELRDSDRTLITQAIHKVESEAGVKKISGPIRRGGFFFPDDIFSDIENRILKTQAEDNSDPDSYFGRDELQTTGPGAPGSGTKFSNSDGQMLELFNDFTEFPAVTYSNGRRVHYPPTSPGVNIEGAEGFADAFVEDRLELSHTSDLTQEVLEEIDGFAASRRARYIERVVGTVVGNDLNSSGGQRQYARILKPNIFPDFRARKMGKFSLQEVDRQPASGDIEAVTSAGAFLFRIRPPRSSGANEFVAAVSKQGKLFLNIPGSTVEDYPSGSKKISAELNLEGALKAFIGASNPDRISAHVVMEGGLHLDIGRDADGNAITVRYRSGVKQIYDGGTPNEDDVASSQEITGVKETTITGKEVKTIEGKKETIVSGMNSIRCDRYSLNAFGGYSGNYGELNMLVSGKSQLQYALAVIENIVAGGKVSTILAGGFVQNVVAGAVSFTAAAGATTFNNPAGAFNITVGTGALSMTTASGAVALSTGAGAMALQASGAIAITAGLALNLTSGASIVATAPTVLLGGPTAVLGVVRGIPSLPPGTPSLDPITGTPLLGSATILSN